MPKCTNVTALLFLSVVGLCRNAAGDSACPVVVYRKNVPKTSSLLLRSKYRQVDYKIEGRFIGTHDGDIVVDSLEPGRYRIVAEKTGCASFERTIYIDKNGREALTVSFQNAHSSPIWMGAVAGGTFILGTVSIIDFLTNDKTSSMSGMGLLTGTMAFTASGIFGVKAIIQVKRRAGWEQENVIPEQDSQAHTAKVYCCRVALEF